MMLHDSLSQLVNKYKLVDTLLKLDFSELVQRRTHFIFAFYKFRLSY